MHFNVFYLCILYTLQDIHKKIGFTILYYDFVVLIDITLSNGMMLRSLFSSGEQDEKLEEMCSLLLLYLVLRGVVV